MHVYTTEAARGAWAAATRFSLFLVLRRCMSDVKWLPVNIIMVGKRDWLCHVMSLSVLEYIATFRGADFSEIFFVKEKMALSVATTVRRLWKFSTVIAVVRRQSPLLLFLSCRAVFCCVFCACHGPGKLSFSSFFISLSLESQSTSPGTSKVAHFLDWRVHKLRLYVIVGVTKSVLWNDGRTIFCQRGCAWRIRHTLLRRTAKIAE